ELLGRPARRPVYFLLGSIPPAPPGRPAPPDRRRPLLPGPHAARRALLDFSRNRLRGPQNGDRTSKVTGPVPVLRTSNSRQGQRAEADAKLPAPGAWRRIVVCVSVPIL